MITKNEKGFALPLALVVMLVITLLGTALWTYSTSDTIQVAYARDKMQSHYVARSGAEAGLKEIQNQLSSNPDTSFNALFTSLNDFSWSDDGKNMAVSFNNPGLNKIKISSFGEADGKDDLMTVQIGLSFDFPKFEGITNPPEWVAGNSFNLINSASAHRFPNNAVTLHNPLNNSQTFQYVQLPQQGSITLVSAILYFREKDGKSLYVQGSSGGVTLDATYIHFEGSVEIAKTGQNLGHLFLQVSEPISGEDDRRITKTLLEGLTDLDGEPLIDEEDLIYEYYGLVYFGGPVTNWTSNNNLVPNYPEYKYYLFPAAPHATNVQFHPTVNAESLLIPISDEAGNMLYQVSSYVLGIESIVWGRD